MPPWLHAPDFCLPEQSQRRSSAACDHWMLDGCDRVLIKNPTVSLGNIAERKLFLYQDLRRQAKPDFVRRRIFDVATKQRQACQDNFAWIT